MLLQLNEGEANKTMTNGVPSYFWLKVAVLALVVITTLI